MEIRIDTTILIENKLTISEYLYLKLLYEKDEGNTEMYQVIDTVETDSLQLKGLIKILDSEIVLRNKGIKLFEGEDLFVKFLSTFPNKSPNGRFLSPRNYDSIKGKVIHKKWKSLFKGKPHLEQRAIDVLEAELEWRRKEDSFNWMTMAETWLNQGHYENFAYLLDDKKQENYKDFM